MFPFTCCHSNCEQVQDDPPTELKPGVDLLGPVDDIFYDSYDIYEPINDWQADNCIISKVLRLVMAVNACLRCRLPIPVVEC